VHLWVCPIFANTSDRIDYMAESAPAATPSTPNETIQNARRGSSTHDGQRDDIVHSSHHVKHVVLEIDIPSCGIMVCIFDCTSLWYIFTIA
jgi:hypothetical protein